MSKFLRVKDMYLSKLNNAEYTHFMSSVERLMSDDILDKIGVSNELILAFRENINTLTDIAKQTKASSETKSMVDLDKERNKLITYFLTAIKNGMKSPTEVKKESAIRLENITRPYTGLRNLPLNQKTQLITSLITDMEAEKNATHINNLAITDAISGLKKLNEQYVNLSSIRAESQLNKPSANAKLVRNIVDGQYEEITTYTFVKSMSSPSEEATNFINRLNQLIEATKGSFKQRRGLTKKTDTK